MDTPHIVTITKQRTTSVMASSTEEANQIAKELYNSGDASATGGDVTFAAVKDAQAPERMFVTTYTNPSDGKDEVFIRLNKTHNGAWNDALAETKIELKNYQDCTAATIDCIEGEGDDSSIIRIINSDNGHEYQAYIIEEFEVSR